MVWHRDPGGREDVMSVRSAILVAGAARGRLMIRRPSPRNDTCDAGATCVDERARVCTDGPAAITSRMPADLGAFDGLDDLHDLHDFHDAVPTEMSARI
jgi:putative intracellular protease/amidase